MVNMLSNSVAGLLFSTVAAAKPLHADAWKCALKRERERERKRVLQGSVLQPGLKEFSKAASVQISSEFYLLCMAMIEVLLSVSLTGQCKSYNTDLAFQAGMHSSFA